MCCGYVLVGIMVVRTGLPRLLHPHPRKLCLLNYSYDECSPGSNIDKSKSVRFIVWLSIDDWECKQINIA